MGTIQKLYAIAEVKAVEDDSWEYGSFEATLSAPVEDRDGEIIDAGAFNPLPTSIPILADHLGEIRSLVARAEPYYDGDILKAKGRFASNDFAQSVRQLLKEGILDTMSVGFMSPERTVKAGKPHITRGELLESSFVVIPSNRAALVDAAKGVSNKVYVNIGPPAGSYEDVIANLRAAIATTQDDYSYVSIIGTFADRVVFQSESWMDGTAATFECGYELDEDGAVTLEEMREVELEQVVSPKTFENWTQRSELGGRYANEEKSAVTTRDDALDLAVAAQMLEIELDLSDTEDGLTD